LKPHLNLFAEDAEINPQTFFYRNFMKDIFKKDKFIIQGFKGTGKTYIYKTLSSSNEIKEKLLKLAEVTSKKYECIDIISLKGSIKRKKFPFNILDMNEIPDKRHYFTNFWKVYTWNSIFLEVEEKLNYEEKSKLEIKEIGDGTETETETKSRFEKIINNDELMIIVEKNLKDLDSYLYKNNRQVFVLYDQLDNLIHPNYWGEVVSPLVYWWDNNNIFKCINPKIFIRTDLYNKLKGTNTIRLQNNKISIEWTREEIYSYFFKLIFSNPESFKALFTFMKRKMPNLEKFYYKYRKSII